MKTYNIKSKVLILALFLGCTVVSFSCEDEGTMALSGETDILTFTLPEETGPATINNDDHTVNIQVSYGTDQTSLTPTFTLSKGASSEPVSDTKGDYSSDVIIDVTAENGTKQDWTVSVDQNPADIVDQNPADCVTKGGRAGDTGMKTWCWAEIPVPVYDGDNNNFYLYKNQIKISNSDRWYEGQLTNVGDKLKFHLNPTTPAIGFDDGYNYRAEIRTAPWDIQNPSGTEEWFGWSYTFGEDYKIDQLNKWVFFQVHNGESDSPQVFLYISDKNSSNAGHVAGKIIVANKGNSDYDDTGIIPVAGQTLNIVVHAIWADASTGLLQVWIDDVSVYNKQVSTVYPGEPWGGNAKWGIYHQRWRNGSDVQNTLDQGITHVETFMGPLRVITRHPDDPDYGDDSYDLVRPR